MSIGWDTDIGLSSAKTLMALVRRGEIASRELLTHYLARIEQIDPHLNAVVTLDSEGAHERAKAADEALARGHSWGPLHGLPMTVKDAFETAGLRTTSGSPDLAGHVPDSDATAVARLRNAGAIIIGKTNLPAYALDVQTTNDLFGTSNNPWDQRRTPGGSSGGAAAAVAAGLTALELGSDIAGSIRIPAHYCGIYGHKPSYGVVPTRGHVPPAPGSLAELDILVAGPLARSPGDLELALDVLTGPDANHAAAWHLRLPPPRRQRLSEYRIACWFDDPFCPVEQGVREVLSELANRLAGEGARLVDVPGGPVDLPASNALAQQLLQATLSHFMASPGFEELCRLAEGVEDSARVQFARHVTQRARDHNLAQERRLQLAARWQEFFRDHDVLLSPVTPTAAIPHDHAPDSGDRTIDVDDRPRPYWDQIVWPLLPGVVHLPVTVVPAGHSPTGLPIGVQVIGPYLEDRTTIDVAKHLAAAFSSGRAPADGPPPLARGRRAAQARAHGRP